MQSGYYSGDGTDDRAITGLGFQPEVVLLKDDTANGSIGIILKTSTMAGEISLALAETDATLSTNSIQSLDPDGFTIGNSAEVNIVNIGQHWTAFSGSDCSATGTFCVGAYIGNGTSQAIETIGFQPDLVIVKRVGGSVGIWKSSAMSGTNSNFFNAAVQLASGGIDSIDATGFSIGSNASVNTNTNIYHFIAFKEVSGQMDVGTYTGDGTDNRDLTSADDAGLTFQPNFVFVKPTTAIGAVGSVSEHFGDRSFLFADVASAANHIQALKSPEGFQVGTSTAVNTTSNTHYYAAFGGANTKMPGTGTFQMANGTYSGNGTIQSFSGLGFSPDLVIIKNDAAQQSIFRTSIMAGDRTSYLANAVTFFTTGITSLDGDGFSVGAHATVNTSANTYYWTAFGNAMRPDKAGGSADFSVGQYIGTGNDNTDVIRLPIAPDLVAIKNAGTAIGIWRTSNQIGDLSLYFSATAGAANFIQALNSDGFQKGTNASVNTSAGIYDYFAFKSGASFKTGTYTGNGTSQNITSIEFPPELLWAKKITGGTARAGILRSSAQVGDAAQLFTATATTTGAVTGLLTDGFSLGNSTLANENTGSYQFASWQKYNLDQHNYRFFQNANSTDVGTAMAASSTPATLATTGADFRLRLLLRVDGGSLLSSLGNFKLQYVDKGSGSCSAPSAGNPAIYTDVTLATTIAFNDNTLAGDGAALTTNVNDPSDGGRAIINQSYEELNNATNSQGTIADTQDGKWDFSLKDNGATALSTYCLRLVAADGAVLDSYSFLPEITMANDVVPPTLVISSTESSPTKNAPIPITFQFSESVANFDIGDITVGNGSSSNFIVVDSDTYTADIIPSSQGTVTVDVLSSTAQDLFGNNNIAATQYSITYDTTSPNATISSAAGTVTNTSPIPINISFDEAVIGFSISGVTTGNGVASNFVAVNADTYTLDVTPSGDGAVTVDIPSSVALDTAGNDNSASTQFNITFDTTDPTLLISSSEISPTSSSPFSVTFQFSEPVTGFALGDISVGNGSVSNLAEVDPDTYTADITPTGAGAVTVDVSGTIALDNAGNPNTAATQFSISYDPTALTTTITSTETSPSKNSPLPVTIEFNANVTGFIVSDITVSNASKSNFVAVSESTYTVDITPDSEGLVTVDVAAATAQDVSLRNNLEAPQLSILYDITGPIPTISSSESGSTALSPIPIFIELNEIVSGFDSGDLIISNGTASNFVAIDGDSYTADITPTTDGTVTINIASSAAQDTAGNDSQAATQFSITYDTTAPEVNITSTESSPTGLSPIPITVQFTESVTGFDASDVNVVNGTVSNFISVDGDTYTFGIVPSAPIVSISVDIAGAVAKDAANIDNSAASQFAIDFVKPPTIFNIQTGFYTGDGNDDRAIAGIGFAPEVVFLKDDTTNGTAGVIIKSSAMAGEISLALSETDATFSTNNIQSLDVDGFTVGNAADVNIINVGQYWTAFGGSDCSATGTMCVGSYTGNGTTQSITSVGFQPDLVIIKRDGISVGIWKSSAMSGTNSNFFNAAVQLASGGIESLDATGFSVGNNASVNTNINIYHFIAFQQVAGKMDVGTYTGNATDNRNLTSSDDAGLTFQPNFAFVKPTTNVGAVASISEHFGDRSFLFEDLASAANHIQTLGSAGGFQVGTSTATNANTNTLYYAAFGGAITKPAGIGTFQMANGTYSGNGTTQSFTGLGFSPDLVLIKNSAAQQSVFRTSLMPGDKTSYLGNAVTFFAGGITALGVDGFSIGAHATVNTIANTYNWTAFGNAIRPDKPGGSSDFLVGQYLGSGNDNTDLTRMPFSPSLVAVRNAGTGAGVWRTSNQAGDLSLYFSATAGAVNLIQSLNSDGFQKGTNASVNTAAAIYDYFAFKSGAGFGTGTYTGNGTTQNITSIGYPPELLWVKKTTGGTARDGVLRTSAQAGDAALPFAATAAVSGAVTALLANGFSVGSSTLANENTGIYQFASWDSKQVALAGYRIYNNADSTDVGSSLAALNTPVTFGASNSAFRIRLLLSVDGGNFLTNTASFKLQFVDKGSGSCALPSGGSPASYTDISTATAIAFNNNGTPNNATALTVNANDPTDGIRTIINQTYQEDNSFSNSEGAIINGQDGKWDFSLLDYGSSITRSYCVRVVKSDGSELDTYIFIPEITVPADTTAPSPIISSAATDPTIISPIPITIQFDEDVVGFTIGDLSIGNGSASNFSTVDSNTYTADITPIIRGTVTVDIAGDVAQDNATNGNLPASSFSIVYGLVRRIIVTEN